MCPWGENVFRIMRGPTRSWCETNSAVVGSFREHTNRNSRNNRMIIDVRLGTYLERKEYAQFTSSCIFGASSPDHAPSNRVDARQHRIGVFNFARRYRQAIELTSANAA